jgi:hypothetical protein
MAEEFRHSQWGGIASEGYSRGALCDDWEWRLSAAILIVLCGGQPSTLRYANFQTKALSQFPEALRMAEEFRHSQWGALPVGAIPVGVL